MTAHDWEEACRYLADRDVVLRQLIDRYPGQMLQVGQAGPFQTLTNAIVGQQISVKAAASVWARFKTLVSQVEPQRILSLGLVRLREAGLSARKAEYVTQLARAFVDGRVGPMMWNHQTDEEVILHLTKLRGIGQWTAEMFLIFHLGRFNVLPLSDLGLLKAAERIFGWEQHVDRAKELFQRAMNWCPFRTVAVWYLWRDIDSQPVAY